MVNDRTRGRIAARIKERAAHCIKHEINDPRAHFITVTDVEVSPDLTSAKIRYSVLGTESQRNQVMHMLKKAGGYIQRQVGRVLQTRTVPHLSFHYDDSVEYSQGMDAVIAAALSKDRDINPDAHDQLVIEGVDKTPADAAQLESDPDDQSDADGTASDSSD